MDGETTVYAGPGYQKNLTTGRVVKYYLLGGRRVAMRDKPPGSNEVYWVHGDHLGSTTVVSDDAGNKAGQAVRYYPYGQVRTGDPETMPTDYLFTGQRREEEAGAYLMGARWYDSSIAHWLSADSIVPDPSDPQSLNRYAFVLGNPLRFVDPTGHVMDAARGGFKPSDLPPDDRDLTDWIVDELVANANSPEVAGIAQDVSSTLAYVDPGSAPAAALGSEMGSALSWRSLVKDGARWDFKDKIRQRLGTRIRIGEQWFEYSVVGNIHYGYVGRAAGFSRGLLHLGASIAEIGDPAHDVDPLQRRVLWARIYLNPEWKSTWYDDPSDWAAVQLGCDLYEEFGSHLTVPEFLGLLVDHSAALHRMPPAWSDPAAAGWRHYPRGTFDGGQP